jgi:hypothetical protein
MKKKLSTAAGVAIVGSLLALLFANSYGHLVPENPFPYLVAMMISAVIAVIALTWGTN